MKLFDVRNAALEWLYSLVGDFGFSIKKKRESVVRSFAGGTHQISSVVINGYPGFRVKFLVCVRIDAIQAIFNKFADVAPDVHSYNSSECIRMERLTPETTTACPHFEPRDKFPDELGAKIVSVVVPFLDGLVDAKSVDHLVNETKLCDSMQPYRGMIGVIAARLSQNTYFEDYVARFLTEMRVLKPVSEREKFLELVEFLRKC